MTSNRIRMAIAGGLIGLTSIGAVAIVPAIAEAQAQDGTEFTQEEREALREERRAAHEARRAEKIALLTETLGITEDESDGWHDTFWLTAMQAAVDPETVRYEQRVQADRAHINGVSLVPLGRTISIGEELMRWRVERTAGIIDERRASAGR